MAETRLPLLDLVYNDETGRYIAHLERKILRFVLEDAKMRALLELLTGDMWDDSDFRKMEELELKQIAIDTLKRRTQMSDSDAEAVVRQRWNDCNTPTPNPASVGKIYAGPDPTMKVPHVVATARPLVATAPYNHELHLQGLERAAKNRQATRGELGVHGID